MNESNVTEEYGIIKEFLLKELPIERVESNDSFEMDLGMDSLDLLSFTEFISHKFTLELTSVIVLQKKTVEVLAEYVAENRGEITTAEANLSELLREPSSSLLPKLWITHFIYRVVENILFRFWFNFRCSGLENIPRNEPFILAPNHQSYLDSLLVTMTLPTSVFKNCYFFGKEAHVTTKFLKFVARTNNVIVLDSDLKSSVQKLATALQNGKNIVIFPEGTRTKDGSVGEYKKLFSLLSKELNIRVVPAVISGAFEAMPKGSKTPKWRQQISVEYLKPISPAQYDSYNELTNVVRANTVDAIVS